MSGIFKISDAAVLGIHAAMYLAFHEDRKISTRELADFHEASEHHFSKVMQRMVRAGLVRSVRGPKGGFELAKSPSAIVIAEIYELFDGPLELTGCLFDKPVCGKNGCMFGPLLFDLNSQVNEFFRNNTLADIVAANATH